MSLPQPRPIPVPELGLGTAPIRVSVWLVPLGAQIVAGERVVELVSDAAAIDLPAPCSGRLIKKLASEDSVVLVGQTLGWISPSPDTD